MKARLRLAYQDAQLAALRARADRLYHEFICDEGPAAAPTSNLARARSIGVAPPR
jgi:hypothetical protein